MKTYMNAVHSEEKLPETVHKNLFHSIAIKAIIVVLITIAAIILYIANRSVVVAENNLAVSYSNALELQYAHPWLEAQNKRAVEYGNALELQYARPWLEAQNKPVVEYGNALELQYAQAWLDKAQQRVEISGSAQKQNPLDCGSSLEMFYACKNGYARP